MSDVAVIHGDMRDVLGKMIAEGKVVQSVVTDPPYGLAFMGRAWDAPDNVAFQPGTWRLCFELLPPGGHLLAFGGTRTFHRLAVAIEEAGFTIRDTVAWITGSGFPKSHNLDGEWDGWGTALKPAMELICVARKPLVGTVAANVLKHGTGALNIDGCRVVASDGDIAAAAVPTRNNLRMFVGDGTGRGAGHHDMSAGRWPANVVHDGSDEVVKAFPQSDSARASGNPNDPKRGANHVATTYGQGDDTPTHDYRDVGSAARFFYSSKADAADRLQSRHPTVKPVDLMRWLVRLVTSPGGTVLDPFAGSGTTGMACMAEGIDCILVEREDEYVKDIRDRIAHVHGEDTPLFSGVML